MLVSLHSAKINQMFANFDYLSLKNVFIAALVHFHPVFASISMQTLLLDVLLSKRFTSMPKRLLVNNFSQIIIGFLQNSNLIP